MKHAPRPRALPPRLLGALLLALGACGGLPARQPPPASAAPAPSPRGGAAPGEERFFDWSALAAPPERLAERRRRIADELVARGGGVLLVPGAPGRSDGGTFRQTDDFLYFTGLELPDSVLAIDCAPPGAARGEASATLFGPRRDARFESAARPNDFPGRALLDDPELARRAGALALRPIEELTPALAGWVAAGRTLWVDARDVSPPATDFVRHFGAEDALLLHLARVAPRARLASAFDAVAALRMVKSPEELELVRRACAITCDAIRRAAGEVRPGVDERTLEGELELAFKRGGAQRPAFDSIVKSGPNSLWPWRVLAAHYDRRNRVLQDGELVIFDVGCELDHYASDVGRTFPVSGRFSDEQRELLEMVTRASDAVLAGVRPGVRFADLRALLLAEIPPERRHCMQAALFFGHHVGLDVGDASLEDAPLAPGMTFTVEPWYYDHERGLAVFLEDVVAVTEDGCEVLTAALPRGPAELEAMTGSAAGTR